MFYILRRINREFLEVSSRFNRLAVDNAHRRRGITPVLLSRQDHENMVHGFPSSLADPTVEIALHGREGREVPGQLAPLAAGRNNVQDRLHDTTQIGAPWPAQSLSLGHQRRYQRPFPVPQVACILQVVPAILRTGDFSPGHFDLIRLSQTHES